MAHPNCYWAITHNILDVQHVLSSEDVCVSAGKIEMNGFSVVVFWNAEK